MAVATPELFADGECGKPLPAGELLQVFTFGQFCAMKVLDDSSEAIVVLGKNRQSSNGSSAPSVAPEAPPVLYARASNGGRLEVERAGEFTFEQLLTGDSSLEAPAPIPILLTQEQVAKVIATGHVEYQERSWALTLTPADVAKLLGGRTVEVDARFEGAHRLFALQPEDALLRQTPERPSAIEIEVPEPELPGFLARPWLPGEDDVPVDLKLEDTNVAELVGDGQTLLKADGREILIKVTTQHPDGNPIPDREDEQHRESEPKQFEGQPEESPSSEGSNGGFRGWGDDRAMLPMMPREWEPPVGKEPKEPEEPPSSKGTGGGVTTGAPGGATAEPATGKVTAVAVTDKGTAVIDVGQKIEPSSSKTLTAVNMPGYQPRRPLGASDFKGITLAVYFEWKQEWILKGFSRGRLLHSLSLAPQEETTIELFTWDRRKRTLEQSSLTETEQSVEDEQKTQDSNEVLRELTKKDEFQWKVGGELDAQYNGGTVNVKLNAQAEAQDKTNAEDVSKNTTKVLREGIQKAAAKVKTQRSTKISETEEIGSEERITRKIRNPNLLHTLNLDYYEVISHYDITTSFNEDGMRFCAMIPNPVAREEFPPEFVRQNESALRDALLDRGLVSGFDGMRLLRARKVALKELEAKRERRKPDSVPSAPGQEKKPDTPAALSAEESAANNYLGNLQQACKKILTESLIGGLRNALRSLDSDQTNLGTKKGVPRPIDLDQGKRWLAQQLFLRHYSQLSQALGELAAVSGPLTIREWGPKLEPIMPSASAMPRPSQLDMESQEGKEGLMREVVRPNVRIAWDWGWWWDEIRRVGLMKSEDAGLGATVEQFEKVYRAFLESESRKSADAPGQALVQEAQQTQDQLSDDDRLEADFPLRDFAMATERSEVLRKHLEEHKNHYSFALFRSLPPQEQLEHIERAMARIVTGFDPGFFQPRAVSQIGSLLLVPLNHEVMPKATGLLDLLKKRIDVKPETDTMLLPTPGMTTDARLGHCSAGEDFIEESRELDLDLRREQVRQAKAEADRLERRLAAEPPELDDPKPQVPRVQVDLEQLPVGPT